MSVGSVVASPSLRVGRLRQNVYLDGLLWSDAYCLTVSLSHGSNGSVASFQIPSLDWDGGKRALAGAQVRVDVAYEGQAAETVFLGYITSVEGGILENQLLATAVSLMGLSDTVYLGQAGIADDLQVEYPARALRGAVMQETGWTMASVLRDIFSSNPPTWRGGGGRLPSGWRSRLSLGSLAILGSAYNQVPLGDLVFRQTTLRDALDQLLGLVGTVSFRERFAGNQTVLDFFELADPAAPVKTLRVARRSEAAADSNILDIRHSEGAESVRTRIIALGDRRRFTISVSTAHPTAPLEGWWNSALNAQVLANPEGTKRGSEAPGDETRSEFTEALSHVFRRYRLPDCLRRLSIDKDLAVELEDGTKLPIQVWKIPRALTYNEETNAWQSTLAEAPVILEGVQFDLDNGFLTLRAPAINLVSSSVDGAGNVTDIYEPAHVGLTLTAAAGRIVHDTGVRPNGMSFAGIAGDGLTEVVQNESFRFGQFTNVLFPFLDGDGIPHTFGATWLYLEGAGWDLYDGAITVEDDEAALRKFAEAALREKNSIRATYEITTPYWTSAYRLGDRVQILGQGDYQHGTHQILSVTYDLVSNHSTTLSTDSNVPLVANDILGSG